MARLIKANLSHITTNLPKKTYNTITSPIKAIVNAINNPKIDYKNINYDTFVKEITGIKEYVNIGKNISIFDYNLLDDVSSSSQYNGQGALSPSWKSPYPSDIRGKSTTANQKQVYGYLRGMGLNDAACAGVMANIEAESAFNPTESGMDTNGYHSTGLFCWNEQFTPRYAYGTTVNSQMNYMAKTIKPSTLRKLQSVPNTPSGAQQAAIIFASEYEVCTKKDYGRREKFARAYYSSF